MVDKPRLTRKFNLRTLRTLKMELAREIDLTVRQIMINRNFYR